GARVLALGYVPILEVPRIKDDDTDALPRNLCLAALIILRERIRPDAARTLEYFTDQGVEVKVVSGDNPATVAAIVRAVGITGAEGIDARGLPADGAAPEIVTGRVFGRVTPELKRGFVHTLQKSGLSVAMTGDGV